MQTISGTFDDRQTAQRAVDQLVACGFARASIQLQTGTTAGHPEAEPAADRGMLNSIGAFFSNLFGDSERRDQAGNDVEMVRPGNSVVAVDTSDNSEVQKAEAIMGQLGTINGNDRVQPWIGEG